MGRGSAPTVAGAATDLVPDGYAAPCSLLLPSRGTITDAIVLRHILGVKTSQNAISTCQTCIGTRVPSAKFVTCTLLRTLARTGSSAMARSAKALQLTFCVQRKPGWLLLSFKQTQRMLSWSISHPGFQNADQIGWLQVRNSDLPPDVDAADFLRARLQEKGVPNGIGLMTSAELRYQSTTAVRDGVAAACIMTLGLSNAERVGQRIMPPRKETNRLGTINMVCHLSIPLSDAALLEAVSVATQARTVAIVEFRYERTPTSGVVTGTGTDCIVVCCPLGAPTEGFAGLHTAVGESLGAAVLEATRRAMRHWIRTYHDPGR